MTPLELILALLGFMHLFSSPTTGDASGAVEINLDSPAAEDQGSGIPRKSPPAAITVQDQLDDLAFGQLDVEDDDALDPEDFGFDDGNRFGHAEVSGLSNSDRLSLLDDGDLGSPLDSSTRGDLGSMSSPASSDGSGRTPTTPVYSEGPAWCPRYFTSRYWAPYFDVSTQQVSRSTPLSHSRMERCPFPSDSSLVCCFRLSVDRSWIG